MITREQIESLPTNNRNYLDFALLTPTTVENFSTSSPQQGIGLNIGGARAKEGSLLVDGFWNTDESFGASRGIKYSQDAMQEFQVVSLGGTAELRPRHRRHRQRGHPVGRQRVQRDPATATSGTRI